LPRNWELSLRGRCPTDDSGGVRRGSEPPDRFPDGSAHRFHHVGKDHRRRSGGLLDRYLERQIAIHVHFRSRRGRVDLGDHCAVFYRPEPQTNFFPARQTAVTALGVMVFDSCVQLFDGPTQVNDTI
jgi:hypothetical protein